MYVWEYSIYTHAQKKVTTLTKWQPHDIPQMKIAEKTEQWANIELFGIAKMRNHIVTQVVS